MVRLVYTCPKTGVVIVGGHFSEQTLMHAYDLPTVVKCPGCREDHHPKVRECSMYRGRRRRALPVPLQAS